MKSVSILMCKDLIVDVHLLVSKIGKPRVYD